MSSQTPPALQADLPQLQAALMTAAGAVSSFPSTPAPDGPTIVSLVDSSVTSAAPDPGTGRNPHGRALGLLINKLTCPDNGPCLGGVEPTLSLPLMPLPGGGFTRDETNGGESGSLADLAKGIIVATHRSKDVAGRPRTIINISQGWEVRYGGEYTGSGKAWDTQLTGGVHMVRAAIGYATCAGAVVIAAAGNNGGGAESSAGSGMIFPAAWENHSVPGPVECAAWNLPPAPTSTTTSRPLVYAVGALDHRDYSLANYRTGGRPILNAIGSHAILSDGDSTTQLYSGTSVSAAVVSAAASIMWSYQPHLSGPDVMYELFAGGTNLATLPDTCASFMTGPAGNCKKQRRISMCTTEKRICAVLGCTSSCTLRAAFEDATPSLSPPTTVTHQWSALAVTSSTTVDGRCNATVWSSSLSTVNNPCPGNQFYRISEELLVLAQPEDPVCPNCFIENDGTLWLNLADSLPGALSDPVLKIVHDSGLKENFILDISSDELVEEATIQITDLSINLTTAEEASIEMTVDDTYSVADPVLLLAPAP